MSKAVKTIKILVFITAFCLAVAGTYLLGSKARVGDKPAMTASDSNKKYSDTGWFEKLKVLLSTKSIDKKLIEDYFNSIALPIRADKLNDAHPIAKKAQETAEKHTQSQTPLIVGIIVRDGDDYSNLVTDIVILRKQQPGKEHPFGDENIATPNVATCRIDLRSFFTTKLDDADDYRAGIAIPAVLAKLGLQTQQHPCTAIVGWDSGDWIEIE